MIRRHRAEIRAEIPALRTPQGACGVMGAAAWWELLWVRAWCVEGNWSRRRPQEADGVVGAAAAWWELLWVRVLVRGGKLEVAWRCGLVGLLSEFQECVV